MQASFSPENTNLLKVSKLGRTAGNTNVQLGSYSPISLSSYQVCGGEGGETPGKLNMAGKKGKKQPFNKVLLNQCELKRASLPKEKEKYSLLSKRGKTL